MLRQAFRVCGGVGGIVHDSSLDILGLSELTYFSMDLLSSMSQLIYYWRELGSVVTTVSEIVVFFYFIMTV